MCLSITSQLPETSCELDLAESTSGLSFSTLKVSDYHVFVDWCQDRGFGITAGRDGEYGEGPDETMPDMPTAQERIIWLLQNRGITSPPTSSASPASAALKMSSHVHPALEAGVGRGFVTEL